MPPGALSPRAMRELLRDMYRAAVERAGAFPDMASALPSRPMGVTRVLAVGKAAIAMARAADREWRSRGLPALAGLAVVPRGTRADCGGIEVVEAGHPVPSSSSVVAGYRALRLAESLGAGDLLLALMSGGGSALLCAPLPGIRLETKRRVNRALLASGAGIAEMNCVRARLSMVKGGRLAAAAHPARVATLVVSDVPGDDPSLVASGPTLRPTWGPQDAARVVRRLGLELPPAALKRIRERPAELSAPAHWERDRVRLVATPGRSLEAAAEVARRHGLRPVVLSDRLQGDAEDVARVHAGIAHQLSARGEPCEPPVALISGGEASVTVRGRGGRGGRNTTFLLRLAIETDGLAHTCSIAADTDGIDGNGDNAGAFCDGATASRLRALDLDPGRLLARRDAHAAFLALDDLVVTGPTGTNVNDFRATIVARRAA